MSSHREAPAISQDPVADNADVYAFVSPDDPTMVTILSNFVPLQGPAGGPNFFEFGDDVLYSIYVDNDGDARPDVTYQFQFSTEGSEALSSDSARRRCSRLTASTARRCTRVRIHVLALPRSGTNREAVRQMVRNASCTASSASAWSRSTRSASPYAVRP